MTLYYPRAHWENPSQPVTGPAPQGLRGTWVIHYPGNSGFHEPLSDDEMIEYCRAMQNDYVTNRGYSIGYSFVVSQSGLAYEARGFDINNAANKGDKMKPEIPNFNAVSMSIQVASSAQNPASNAAVVMVNQIIALEPDWDVITHIDVDYTQCCGTGMIEQVRSGVIGQSTPPAPSGYNPPTNWGLGSSVRKLRAGLRTFRTCSVWLWMESAALRHGRASTIW